MLSKIVFLKNNKLIRNIIVAKKISRRISVQMKMSTMKSHNPQIRAIFLAEKSDALANH